MQLTVYIRQILNQGRGRYVTGGWGVWVGQGCGRVKVCHRVLMFGVRPCLQASIKNTAC